MQVINLVLTSGEVKRNKHQVPDSFQVDLNIDNIKEELPGAVVLDFTYKVLYLPDIGSVKITGRAYCRETPENAAKLVAGFKSKKIPLDIAAGALNFINGNVGLNSIFLMRPFNLVPPFMPPPIFGSEDLTKTYKIAGSPAPQATAAKPSKKK